MSVQRYLLTLGGATIVCFLAWGMVLFRIDRRQAVLLVTFRFMPVFFGSWWARDPLGIQYAVSFFGKETPFRIITISMRQALWITLFIIISLLLLSQGASFCLVECHSALVMGLGSFRIFFSHAVTKFHDQLEQIKNEALGVIQEIKSDRDFEHAYNKYLGRKGLLPQLLREIKNLSVEEKKTIGRHGNGVRAELEQAFHGVKQFLGGA